MLKISNLRKHLIVLTTAVFFCQNCGPVFLKRTKEIPVTSNPAGARIMVDGEFMGQTPWMLKLKKNRNHTIRLEVPGYNPLEIKIKRKISGSLALSVIKNLYMGAFGAMAALAAGGVNPIIILFPIGPFLVSQEDRDKFESRYYLVELGFLLGFGGGILVDALTGASLTLTPAELNVTLTKIEGRPQPGIIIMDADEAQNIKWIRVKLADSAREDDILSLDFAD